MECLRPYFLICFFAFLLSSNSLLADHKNDWILFDHGNPPGLGIAIYENRQLGTVEWVSESVFGHSGGHDIFISCNLDGSVDLGLHLYEDKNHNKVKQLFRHAVWADKPDSFHEASAMITVSALRELEIKAVALINDDDALKNYNLDSIWIFSERLSPFPLFDLLAASEFSVRINNGTQSEIFTFKPKSNHKVLNDFLLGCESFGKTFN